MEKPQRHDLNDVIEVVVVEVAVQREAAHLHERGDYGHGDAREHETGAVSSDFPERVTGHDQ
jgi:hypothetical protein